MKNIAIDIDDVILQYVPALIKYLNNRFGTKIKKRQIKSWDLASYYPIPRKKVNEIWDEFTKEKEYSNLKLVAGAKYGLQKISEYGNIYLVTYRKDSLKEKTEKNLEKIPKVWKDLIFSNKCDKINIYKKLNAFIVIDDSKRHVLEAMQNGIEILLFNQPWNQDLDVGNKRVKNWKEILQYFYYF